MSIMISEYFAELTKIEEEIREELLEEIMAFEHDAELGYEEDWGKQMGELEQSLEESSRTIEALSWERVEIAEEKNTEEKQLKDSYSSVWLRNFAENEEKEEERVLGELLRILKEFWKEKGELQEGEDLEERSKELWKKKEREYDDILQKHQKRVLQNSKHPFIDI